MPFTTLPAHFDGEKICLDEPYPLRPNITLMVVVLPEQKDDISASDLRLGHLPALFRTLPRLSPQETDDFGIDLQAIRTEFQAEELIDPWASS
jgi:hypothetical protein